MLASLFVAATLACASAGDPPLVAELEPEAKPSVLAPPAPEAPEPPADPQPLEATPPRAEDETEAAQDAPPAQDAEPELAPSDELRPAEPPSETESAAVDAALALQEANGTPATASEPDRPTLPPPPEPLAANAIEPRVPATTPAETSSDAFAGLQAPNARCDRVIAISVEKSRRQLTATCEGGASYRFRVGLGRRAFFHKNETGDLRTPEGTYRVAEAARGSEYHLFMLLDYPSSDDAARALERGLITRRTYERIASAHARGQLPPQDTPLGGRVGIHGEGGEHRGFSAVRDWTFGCIALSDADIEFLAYRTAAGTPVEILP